MTRRIVGRYALFDEIARGGMASIHLARLTAAAGFSRTVVVKRMQPELALDPQFCAMFMDEARLAARVRHPNVVQTIDVISEDGELLLVLDYVHGSSLSTAIRGAAALGRHVPIAVANAILIGTLHGIHAAHTATNEEGEALQIVHRDVSPPNILIGTDGVARLIDFGVAKAVGRLQVTEAGGLRGKLAYMPPEQVVGHVTAASDLYAAGVVLWEAWTGRRFFEADNEAGLVLQIMDGARTSARSLRPELSSTLEAFVMRAVAREAEDRFPSAEAMAAELESVGPVASVTEVGAWVREVSQTALAKRAAMVASIEADTVSRPDASLITSRRAASLVAPLGDDVTAALTPAPLVHASHSSQSRQIFSVAATAAPKEKARGRAGVAVGVALVACAVAFAGLGNRLGAMNRAAGGPETRAPLAPVLPPLATSATALSLASSAVLPALETRSALDAGETVLAQERPVVVPSKSSSPPSRPGGTSARGGRITAAGPNPAAVASSTLTSMGAETSGVSSAQSSATTARCDPPYDIDPATGDKRYKRECLRR